jgi:hypothetical protein
MDLEPLSRKLGYQFFSDGGSIGKELSFYHFGFYVVFPHNFLETVFSSYFCATDSFGTTGFEICEEFLDVGVFV